MDILAGMLAYLAGIGALFGGLALSFFVFFSTPHEPLQTQPQGASAMLVQPSTLNKPAAVGARAKQSVDHSEKHATAAGSPGSAQASARDVDQTRCILGSSAAAHPGGAFPPLDLPARLKLRTPLSLGYAD